MQENKFRGMVYGLFKSAEEASIALEFGKQKLHRIMTGKQLPCIPDIIKMSKIFKRPIPEILSMFYNIEE
jgi:hypothetical protein